MKYSSHLSSDIKRSIYLYLLIFTCFFVISIVTFPATGMWQLIDAEKLIGGAVLYKDVKAVIPPGFYLEFVPFVFLKIKSIFFYRVLGVFLLSLTFLSYCVILRKYLDSQNSLIATLITLCIYIITPWEIFNSYSYIACILVLSSLYYYYKNTFLSLFLIGLAICFKITIGGAVLIGYLISFILRALIYKKMRMQFNQLIIKKIVFTSLSFLIGILIPILILRVFSVQVDLISLFKLVFSGESKGGLYASLLHPIRSFLNFYFAFKSMQIPDGLPGFLTGLKLYFSLLSIALVLNILWFITLVSYITSTINYIRQQRYNKFIYYLPIILSLLGSTYASAMSSYIKSDDIFLLSFLFLMVYKYLDPKFRNYYLLISCLPFIFIILMILLKSTFANASLLILFNLIGIYCLWNTRMRMASVVVLTFMAIAFKLYCGPLAWWETNIKGKYLTNFTSLGFFATPYYAKLTNELYFIKDYSQSHNIPLTVYSFPTSSLPYTIFEYLPEWHFTIHHADVFPKSQVVEEFTIINRVKPSFVVISRWNSDKLAELDNEYSPGSITSQHKLSDLIDKMLLSDYILCSSIAYNPNYDSYNHPTEFYLNKRYVDKENIFRDLCTRK